MYLEHFDKLWGYITVDVPGNRYHKRRWTWWATTGKTINLKRVNHSYYNLESTKAKNGYVDISEQELLAKWPNFKEELDSKVLYDILTTAND